MPSDITRGGAYVRDLETGILLQAMVDAGLIATVVLDCCYSGQAMTIQSSGRRAASQKYTSRIPNWIFPGA